MSKENGQDTVAAAYNPSIGEAEAGGLQVLHQLELHSKLQDSMGYTVRSYLKKKERRKEQREGRHVFFFKKRKGEGGGRGE